ncbi:hypothetical protein ACFLQO_00105 [Candidatus Aenigmatarchaeota archaeon]
MHPSIFRAYDIRGVYGKDITKDDVEIIGNSLARVLKENKVVIGRDVRVSSEDVSKAFINGLRRAGKDVVDVGMVSLGVGSLYAWKRKLPFAYITASHMPADWTGIKFFSSNGIGFMEEDNHKIRDLSLKGKMESPGGEPGRIENENTEKVIEEYVEFLLSKIMPKKKMKVLLDCGNGAACVVARKLFEKAGFDVDVLFEEPDGSFPNRSPDNFEDPLTVAKERVRDFDFGIAYDGDGDRAVIIDCNGSVLTPEQTSYIILEELIQKEKGPVIANVECTKVIDLIPEKFGREVKRIRVGHTFLMDAVHRERACFGAERAGHYVIPSIFPTDDSLAVSYYFACVLSSNDSGLSEIAKGIPTYPFKRVNFECDDEKKFMVMNRIKERMMKEHENVNTLDGVRIDLERGWVLVRPSNTSPTIRLTMEGKDEQSFKEIKNRFSAIIEEEISGSGQ